VKRFDVAITVKGRCDWGILFDEYPSASVEYNHSTGVTGLRWAGMARDERDAHEIAGAFIDFVHGFGHVIETSGYHAQG